MGNNHIFRNFQMKINSYEDGALKNMKRMKEKKKHDQT